MQAISNCSGEMHSSSLHIIINQKLFWKYKKKITLQLKKLKIIKLKLSLHESSKHIIHQVFVFIVDGDVFGVGHIYFNIRIKDWKKTKGLLENLNKLVKSSTYFRENDFWFQMKNWKLNLKIVWNLLRFFAKKIV